MGLCVLVFESSGELGDRPQETEYGGTCCSGTGFVVGALHPVGRLLALLLVLPWKISQVCSINMLYFGKCATMNMNSLFQVQRVMEWSPVFSEAGDVLTEAEARHMRRRKEAVITRRLVPLSGQEPGPVDVGSHERSRVMLEQAFDDGNIEFK